MLYVGLTGNIASGKSEVTRLLTDYGATVIDADILAREAVAPGTDGLKGIIKRWGQKVLNDQGELDRAELRRIVFEDRSQLNELNTIVHPEVEILRSRRLEEARLRGDKIVIYAVPLLFEAGMQHDFDKIVLIDAPQSAQLERLIKNRGLDPTEAVNMVRSQMSVDLKRPGADYIVTNHGSIESLHLQVKELWNWLTRLAEQTT